MSLQEKTVSVTKPEVIRNPPDVLHPRKFEFELPPGVKVELGFLSLGHNASSSARIQGISVHEVSQRLSLAQELTGARNRYELTTLSIQGRLIDLEIETDPTFRPLSSGQDHVLRLVTLGWTTSEIQSEFGITEAGANSRILWAEKKLGAKNRRHLIRRSFEKGIFKLDEPILRPSMTEDDAHHLEISVDNTVLSTKEIGLKTENELTVVKILGSLGIGYFNGPIMSSNGFSPNSPSQHTRSNVFRATAAKVERKINQAFDQTVLDSHGTSRNNRYYFVVREMAIGTPESMQTIEPVRIEELPKPTQTRRGATKIKPKQAKKQPKKNERINKQRPRLATKPSPEEIGSEAIEVDNPYIDLDNLPDLDQTLFSDLVPRSPDEVSTNRSIVLALREIMQSEQAPFEYRDKLVASLRFGMPSTHATFVSRREQRISLTEIMEAVPTQQGIDTASVSLITGLKPVAILENELAFLKKHQKRYPALSPLIKVVTKELVDLRKKSD